MIDCLTDKKHLWQILANVAERAGKKHSVAVCISSHYSSWQGRASSSLQFASSSNYALCIQNRTGACIAVSHQANVPQRHMQAHSIPGGVSDVDKGGGALSSHIHAHLIPSYGCMHLQRSARGIRLPMPGQTPNAHATWPGQHTLCWVEPGFTGYCQVRGMIDGCGMRIIASAALQTISQKILSVSVFQIAGTNMAGRFVLYRDCWFTQSLANMPV